MLLNVFLFLAFGFRAFAQQKTPIIYASVLSNSRYVVGAKNRETGLFVSSDFGNTWQHVGWKNIRCFGMAMDPQKVGEVFYLASGNGVLKTVNGGKRWGITTGWRVTEVQEIVVNSVTPQKLVIGTPYGVFRSENAGRSWQSSNTGLNTIDAKFISALEIDRQNPDHLLLGTEAGLFGSRDGGKTWKRVALQGEPVRDIEQNLSEPAVFYLGTENKGVFKSTDGGKVWAAVNHGIQYKTVYVLAIDRTHPNTVYAGTYKGGVYKTTNGGRRWKAVNKGLTNRVLHGLAIVPGQPNIVFAGTVNGGIFKSTNGGNTWHYSGLNGAQVWKMEIW